MARLNCLRCLSSLSHTLNVLVDKVLGSALSLILVNLGILVTLKVLLDLKVESGAILCDLFSW
ncbi:hypothetical protein BpHYR1_004684 [Brachionus plicatilis]|uniref:Uncharacterized protein n=1 Tax=Brachionus plicatilis TaxID=10195 RepID=A0A3M7R3W3_BRAPC|nr:hypothetical protein BpHYR1_004684 [Brachionus plicatilis]